MAVNRKKIVLKEQAPQEPRNVSLRVPDKLFELAQQCGQVSGLSLNGLICSALADYLTARGYKVHPSQK